MRERTQFLMTHLQISAISRRNAKQPRYADGWDSLPRTTSASSEMNQPSRLRCEITPRCISHNYNKLSAYILLWHRPCSVQTMCFAHVNNANTKFTPLPAIGIYRDVWNAAIASSRKSLTTLSGVMCNTSQ